MLCVDYAHDLKIAVQMMISCAQMIQMEVEKSAPQAEEYARMLVENGWQAVRFLQGALDERCAEYFALNAKMGDAAQAVSRAAERFMPRAREKGLRLSLHADHAPILFAFDEDKLARIAMNLLSNALKYARSRVRVRVCALGDCFELCVEDDGAGFAQNPFSRPYRAEENGVGLVEVRHFARLHGGQAQALRQGAWTSFVVTLPMKPRALC